MRCAYLNIANRAPSSGTLSSRKRRPCCRPPGSSSGRSASFAERLDDFMAAAFHCSRRQMSCLTLGALLAIRGLPGAILQIAAAGDGGGDSRGWLRIPATAFACQENTPPAAAACGIMRLVAVHHFLIRYVLRAFSTRERTMRIYYTSFGARGALIAFTLWPASLR
jgi:hypothetical protein